MAQKSPSHTAERHGENAVRADMRANYCLRLAPELTRALNIRIIAPWSLCEKDQASASWMEPPDNDP